MKVKDAAIKLGVSEGELKRLLADRGAGPNPTTVSEEQLVAIGPAIEQLKSLNLSDLPSLPTAPASANGSQIESEAPAPEPTKKRGGRLTKAEKAALETQISSDVRQQQTAEIGETKVSSEQAFTSTSDHLAAQKGATDAAREFAIRIGTKDLVLSQLLDGYTAGLVNSAGEHAAASANINLYDLVSQFGVQPPDAQKKSREEVKAALELVTQASAEYRNAVAPN